MSDKPPMKQDDGAALDEIRMLKARYLQCVDTKDWDILATLFTPDASLHPAGTADTGRPPSVSGPYAIIDWIRRGLADATSMHLGLNPQIMLLSADEARGIWAMEDQIEWPDRSLHGFGHYHDRYLRQGGRWLIAETRLERTCLTITPYR
ncbi:nuclear transport factor 2 family protein [Sphingobium sp. TKS]|uniref:nuclear transport factor 2 family protein n=1 Tax=Sphingobium sp. TKS TaxID=1315974 RepID=UPI00076FFB5E|nr:nuclear transport factor 2 family protein [Sphingobium sp. TKS]AMK25607.1 hypothetical protein K426_23519 [Sphingobium sp. TKS]